MKKYELIGLCSVIVMAISVSKADVVYPLFAGQTLEVGTVTVTDDLGIMTVVYDITDANWCLTQTHLDIETSLAAIPQTKKGNPIPGHFEFSDSGNCLTAAQATYTKAIASNTKYFIAAHAVVYDENSGQTLTIVSDTNTAVTEVNGMVLPIQQSAVEAYEPVTYPTCSGYTLVDTANDAVWDSSLTPVGTSAAFNAAGADWIWNTANPEHVVDGDVVTFQETFTCVAPDVGTLLITANNGYHVQLNGTSIGSGQLFAAFPGSLKQDGVDTNNWQSVESWPLNGFVNGKNTLTIIAANEYMDTDDGNDPFPGTGKGGTSEGDNICRNPGGLIFKATLEGCLTEHQTAWGDGFNFVGKQWGTYIEYTTKAAITGICDVNHYGALPSNVCAECHLLDKPNSNIHFSITDNCEACHTRCGSWTVTQGLVL